MTDSGDRPRTVLRPLRPDDAARIAAWGLDERFRRAADWSEPDGDKHERFHRQLIEHPSPDQERFGVEVDGALVGCVELYRQATPGEFEVGIVIGPSAAWGNGYGVAALRAALELAWRELGAGRVWAETHEPNLRSRRMLAAAGFREIGRQGTDTYDGAQAALIQFEITEPPRVEPESATS